MGKITSFIGSLGYARKMQKCEEEGRKRLENLEFQKHLLFTWEITHQCNLECGHCFAESSPRNHDFIDEKVVERVAGESIKVFPKYGKRTIRITGGDPFLHTALYDIVRSFSSRKERLNYYGLDVETNGWWAVDDERAKEVVGKLKEAGADSLSMTNDYWHRLNSPFKNSEHASRIERVSKENDLLFRMITVAFPLLKFLNEKGELIPAATPIGRGRELPEEYWVSRGQAVSTDCFDNCRLKPSSFITPTPPYIHDEEVTLDPLGNVYLCNSGKQFKHASLSIGNVNKSPLTEILSTGIGSNPVMKLLREKGLRALTETAGLSAREHWRLYDKMTPCGLCHETLRVYGEKIAGRLAENQ